MTKQLKKQNSLLTELHVAKELGMTLRHLRHEMTEAELWLWVTYFNLQNEEQEEAIKKASKRRR